MKKVFKMEDLDCAHCAQKMEDAIAEIEGVTKVKVNFMMQKLTLEAEDSVFDDVLKKAIDVCKSVEPDCTIVVKS